MPQSYTDLVGHFVFSTRDRQEQITEGVREGLYAYAGGVCKNLDCDLIAIGGMPDHVHLLVLRHPTVAEAELMRVVKANTSKWVHERHTVEFAWQKGYGAFSVSRSSVERVKKYVLNQAAHHKRMTFKEEFVAFLKRHRVKYDERYIWE
jgi:putative transposase